MKNLFLNDLVFLLTNRFRLKQSLTEFSPDLFGTLNDNCCKMGGGGGVGDTLLLLMQYSKNASLKKRLWFNYKETDKTEKTETYTINL